MFKRILVVTILIFIGACASSGPEAPAPAVTASSASVDAAAQNGLSAPPASDLQDQDAKDMPQTASTSPENDPNELICRRERETGSKFSQRICRTRAEIEAREAQDQLIIQQGRKIQTGGACALSGDC